MFLLFQISGCSSHALCIMAFLEPLQSWKTPEDYKQSVGKQWFMDSTLWVKNVVYGKVVDSELFTNNIKFRCLLVLQSFGILPIAPPVCNVCNRAFRKLVERNDASHYACYEFSASCFSIKHADRRCSACYGTRKNITSGTNMEGLTDWPAFLHTYVLMNKTIPHKQIKDTISRGYGIKPGNTGTITHWIIWILEMNHLYTWIHFNYIAISL